MKSELEAAATAPTVVAVGGRASSATATEPIEARRRRAGRPLALAAVALIAAAAALWSFPELRPWSQTRGSTELAEEEGAAVEEREGDSAIAAAGSGAQDRAGVQETEESSAAAERSPRGNAPSAETGEAVTATSEAGAAAAGTQQPARDAAAAADVTPRGVREGAPRPGRETMRSLYPASNVERVAVNRVVSRLVRAIEARDSAAIARVYGGRVPEENWRLVSRLIQGPRTRIRHDIVGVGSTGEGIVVAEVDLDILFVGQPGRVRPPRKATWILRFGSDKSGIYLQAIRPR